MSSKSMLLEMWKYNCEIHPHNTKVKKIKDKLKKPSLGSKLDLLIYSSIRLLLSGTVEFVTPTLFW